MSAERHVLVEAAGHAFAIPADSVQAIHDDLTVQRIAGTRRWFLGLAVADGGLLPVSDLSMLFGARRAEGRVLQLHPDVGIAGLRVERVCGLSDQDARLQTDEQAPLSMADTAVNLDDALSAVCVLQGGRRFRLLDVAALLQCEDFLDVAAAPA